MINSQYKSDAMDLVVKLQRENSALFAQANHMKQLVDMVCEKLGCDLKSLPDTLDKINDTTNTVNTSATKENKKAG